MERDSVIFHFSSWERGGESESFNKDTRKDTIFVCLKFGPILFLGCLELPYFSRKIFPCFKRNCLQSGGREHLLKRVTGCPTISRSHFSECFVRSRSCF